jgi:Tol biopolymer transport system component
VAFESAPGNLNFAKRYGKMAVFVGDLARGTVDVVSPSANANEEPRTSYNPTISADGRRVAYESYATTEDSSGRPEILFTDLPSGRTRALHPAVDGLAGTAEPRLSGDGRFLAFTGSVVDGQASQVFVADLARGATAGASEGVTDAFEADLSFDGRRVAFTQLVAGTRSSRIHVRDMATGEATLVAPVPGDGLAPDAAASEPAISASGRFVAFTARDATGPQTAVYVRDLKRGTTELVSRADGPSGPPAAGSAAKPSISDDGRRITFTSDAWNLASAKCNSARGVFVRDRTAQTTRLLSAADGANRYLGPTKGSSTSSDMTVALLCA